MIKITTAMLDAAEDAAWRFSTPELRSLLEGYQEWPDASLEALRDALYKKFLADRKDVSVHITLREVDAVLAVRRVLNAKKQDWTPRARHRKEEPR